VLEFRPGITGVRALALLAALACATALGACAGRQSKAGTPAGEAMAPPAPSAPRVIGSEASPAPAATPAPPSAASHARSAGRGEAGSPRNVSASPVATPGSSGVVGATAGAVGKVVLFPLKVASNEVKKNYSADDTSGLAAVRAAEAARPGAKPKTRIEKAEDALGNAVDNVERTIAFPWRILDDFLGFLFSPF
jgi:hypothetical protein